MEASAPMANPNPMGVMSEGGIRKSIALQAIYSGYLQKKGEEGFFKFYKRRFFTLFAGVLAYYEEQNGLYINSIPLDVLTTVSKCAEPLVLTISHHFKRRVYYLKADNENILNTWINHLNSQIELQKASTAQNPNIAISLNAQFLMSGPKGSRWEFELKVQRGTSPPYNIMKTYTQILALYEQFRGFDKVIVPGLEPPSNNSKTGSLSIHEVETQRKQIKGLMEWISINSQLNKLPVVHGFCNQETMIHPLLSVTIIQVRNLKLVKGHFPTNIFCRASVYRQLSPTETSAEIPLETPMIAYRISQTWPLLPLYFELPLLDDYNLDYHVKIECVMVGDDKQHISLGVIHFPVQKILNFILQQKLLLKNDKYFLDHWFPLSSSSSSTSSHSSMEVSGDIHMHLNLYLAQGHAAYFLQGKYVDRLQMEFPVPLVLNETELLEWRKQEVDLASQWWSGELLIRYIYNPPYGDLLDGSLSIEIITMNSYIRKDKPSVSSDEKVIGLKDPPSNVIYVTVKFGPHTKKSQPLKLLLSSDVMSPPATALHSIDLSNYKQYSRGFGIQIGATTLHQNNLFQFRVPVSYTNYSPSSLFQQVKFMVHESNTFSSDLLLGEWTLLLSDWILPSTTPSTTPSPTTSATSSSTTGTGTGNVTVVTTPSASATQQQAREIWIPMSSHSSVEQSSRKNIAKKLARSGYKAKYPVCLIPGFASSVLRVLEGAPHWVNERIWIDLARLGGETVKNKFRKDKDASTKLPSLEEDDPSSGGGPIVSGFKNEWMAHMALAEDGHSDPPNIRVRATEGIEGVAYLCPGLLTNAASFVYGPLLEQLTEVGYSESEGNILAMPYDWRLPPHFLEERDQYFTRLKQGIEELYVTNQHSPVVVICHSMGNRTFQYFLNWIQKQSGNREWMDKYLYSFVAVGAPFLGAPKALRGLLSGERMGLDAFLDEKESIKWGRTYGSTKQLLPLNPAHYFPPDSSLQFVNLHGGLNGGEKDLLTGLSLKEALEAGKCEGQWQQFNNYYVSDPLFGGEHVIGEAVLEAPPVPRFLAIYGVNLDTEIAYIYQPSTLDPEYPLILDTSFSSTTSSNNGNNNSSSGGGNSMAAMNISIVKHLIHYKVKKGVVSETENTPQITIKNFTGIEGTKSGDGTVPYASLAYCRSWKPKIPQFQVEEIPKADHRAILAHPLFFLKIIEYICDRPSSSSSSTTTTLPTTTTTTTTVTSPSFSRSSFGPQPTTTTTLTPTTPSLAPVPPGPGPSSFLSNSVSLPAKPIPVPVTTTLPTPVPVVPVTTSPITENTSTTVLGTDNGVAIPKKVISVQEMGLAESILKAKKVIGLASHIEQRVDPRTSALYYVDHLSKSTSYQDPRMPYVKSLFVQYPLPLFMEPALDQAGRIYFVNHQTHSTTYNDPRLPSYWELRVDPQGFLLLYDTLALQELRLPPSSSS